jgi:hypothetical protein
VQKMPPTRQFDCADRAPTCPSLTPRARRRQRRAVGTKNPDCSPRGTDRPLSRWIALSLLLLVTAACGFPRPPDIGGDAARTGCSRDQDCGSPTPFCVNSACVACRDSTSCPLTRPVCDRVGHDCRTCVQDGECDSGACDLAAGRCVDQGAILYASPAGFGTDPCTQTSPCSMQRAAQLVNTNTPYIVLRQGRYSGGADFNGKKATITGSNAIIDIVDDPLSLVTIENGSVIFIRNINMADHVVNLMAETLGAIVVDGSNLTIDNMQSNTTLIRAVGVARDVFANGSILTITNSSFSGPGVLGSGPGLIIDRCIFRNFSSNPFSFPIGTDDSIQLTNSILSSDSMHQTFFLPKSTTQESHIVHNTFVGGTGIDCQATGSPLQIFDSNIFYNVPTISPPVACQYRYNLSVPDAGLTGIGNIGNITGDPMFKDAANGNFHLRPGSAALDAANPGDVFTGHDFDGTPRPQGARSDIGAFEYVPAP